ncbi:fimbria/pilus chaperone family protein [Pseudomonas sp. NPDC098747]|uniref:fimbria/pilus chaperone family protein n=1 Tax=Pseudomonas sp. NPDC098747 TaxID=3364487 RepID=UPI00383B206D
MSLLQERLTLAQTVLFQERMMRAFRQTLCAGLAAPFMLLSGGNALAAGMQPETSVVIVDEGKGEAELKVTNTDNAAALLHTALETIAEDPEMLLFATPPVARVEGGETQLVRFILQSKAPLLHQRLMRVTFEGIPMNESKKPNSVGVTYRQNLPVIISPKGLAPESAPWKHLKWSMCDKKLRVINDSPYVVRMALQGSILPSGGTINFPRTYLLPNTSLDLKLASSADANGTQVRIHPASVYGYAVKQYEAALSACTTKG